MKTISEIHALRIYSCAACGTPAAPLDGLCPACQGRTRPPYTVGQMCPDAAYPDTTATIIVLETYSVLVALPDLGGGTKERYLPWDRLICACALNPEPLPMVRPSACTLVPLAAVVRAALVDRCPGVRVWDWPDGVDLTWDQPDSDDTWRGLDTDGRLAVSLTMSSAAGLCQDAGLRVRCFSRVNELPSYRVTSVLW